MSRADFQFCLAVYLKAEYETQSNASNLYSEWGGVEFGNSWNAGRDRAQAICKKNPEYLCVLSDEFNRKKPIVITLNHEQPEN